MQARGLTALWDPAPFIRGARFRHGAEAALSDAAAFDSVLVDDFGAMVGCRCSAEVLLDFLRGRRAAAPPEQLVLDADGYLDSFVFRAPRAARRGAQPQAVRIRRCASARVRGQPHPSPSRIGRGLLRRVLARIAGLSAAVRAAAAGRVGRAAVPEQPPEVAAPRRGVARRRLPQCRVSPEPVKAGRRAARGSSRTGLPPTPRRRRPRLPPRTRTSASRGAPPLGGLGAVAGGPRPLGTGRPRRPAQRDRLRVVVAASRDRGGQPQGLPGDGHRRPSADCILDSARLGS